MARVAVTGGTGFVGANLVRRLLADGHEMHLLVRPEHHAWRLADVLADVHRREVDLADGAGLADLVRVMRPDQVFHLAAHGAYPWQVDHDEMMVTNVIGTRNLVEAAAAAEVRAFVHTGSSSEYGRKDHAPTEDEAIEPNSFYALTKAWATMACRFSGFTTLRLYSVYGPWEDPRRFVPSLVEHGLRGTLPLLADPAIARDFVYVDDAVDALVRAASDEPGRAGVVYNVGTGVQTTLRDAVAVARAVLGIEAEPAWNTMAPRAWDTAVWVADNGRINDALGWQPATSFTDGFAKTVDWHRALAAQAGTLGAAGAPT